MAVGHEKSLKHKLGSISGFGLLPVICSLCGNILIPYTRGCRFEYFFKQNSVEVFKDNSNALTLLCCFCTLMLSHCFTLRGGRESQTFFL